ncbi:MAG: DUF1489 domain-containing protein [Alphaproteobacteria bacterium]|nr:DUF1489 domain-containing protein [Alphaproteobacteria bacterium]
MALNLIKLCVGIDTVEQLAAFQKRRRAELTAAGLPAYNRHLTRNFPRRVDEIMDPEEGPSGSLFWVIRREVRVRQPFHAIEEAVDHEGRRCCALVLEPELIRVDPRPHRPFQGWRYLPAADAPADLAGAETDGTDEMPEEMLRELRALGLI